MRLRSQNWNGCNRCRGQSGVPADDQSIKDLFRNDRKQRYLIVVFSVLLVCTGCAHTKSVEPVAMSQNNDQNLTCSELDHQIDDNRGTAVNFANRAREVKGDNEKLAVTAVLVSGWAALFIDLSNEEKIKMRSLQDRNQYLVFLKEQKQCQP